MPGVPRYNTQVAPGNVPTVQYGQVDNPYSELAQGISQLGAGVGKYHDEASQTQAREAANLRDAELSQLKLQYAQQQGKNAVMAQPEYTAKINEINAKHRASLDSNPTALKYYTQTEIPALSATKLYVDGHAAQQGQAVQDQTDKDREINYTKDSIATASDPKVQAENIDAGKKLIESVGLRKGLDSKSIETKQAAFVSGVHVAAVNNLLDSNNTQQAQQYYNTRKSEIDPKQWGNIEARLVDSNVANMSRDKTLALESSLTAKYDANIKSGDWSSYRAEGLAEIAKEKDAKVADQMRARFLTNVNDQQVNQSEALKAQYSAFEKKVAKNNGHLTGLMDGPDWEALPPAAKANFIAKNRAGEGQISDPQYMQKIDQMFEKAQTIGDYKNIEADLLINSNKLDVHTQSAYRVDLMKQMGEFNKPATNNQEALLKQLVAHMDMHGYGMKKGETEPNKQARGAIVSRFYAWFETNKDKKQLTNQDIADFYATETKTVPISSAGLLGLESLKEYTVNQMGAWGQTPNTMPDNVAVPTLSVLDPIALRASAPQISAMAAGVGPGGMDPLSQKAIARATMHGLVGKEAIETFRQQYEQSNRKSPNDSQLYNYIIMQTAAKKEKEADDLKKNGTVFDQVLRGIGKIGFVQ